MTCPNCAAAEARATAAEGERDALRAERDAPMGGYGVPSGPMREFYPRVIAKLEAEAAEARGREKALREALEAMFVETGAANGHPSSDSPAERLARAVLARTAGTEEGK